jgi:hypothetical protein
VPRSSAQLVRLLGYEVEGISLCADGVDANVAVHALLRRAQEEIHAGRPALVWHAFTTAEYDVVCGYDENEHVFYGRGSYAGLDGYATAHETRAQDCGNICPPLGAVFVGRKVGAFDARAAEIASLRFAVEHAHSQKNREKLGGQEWVFLEGLLAYERWVNDFSRPDKTRGAGDAYCYGIYRSTHRAAASYLAEIAGKYPTAQARLLAATQCFAAEAGILDQAQSLLGWQSPEGPDAERNQQAAELLARACANYRHGIDEIEASLDALEG